MVIEVKTDTEKLVEEFTEWADERIGTYRDTLPLSPNMRMILETKIGALAWAKVNLNRIAKGMNKR